MGYSVSRKRTCLQVVVFTVFVAWFIAGCATRPFKPDFYLPLRIDALPGLKPVAVYLFIDKRGKGDPADAGEVRLLYAGTSRERATEPVAIGVTRAFLEGFRVRGYPVVDMTSTAFDPSGPKTNAQVAVSGDVVEFGWQIVRKSTFEYAVTAACAGRLLAEALAHSVEDAMSDPELTQVIGAKRN